MLDFGAWLEGIRGEIDDDKGRKTVVLYMKPELIELIDGTLRANRNIFTSNASFSDIVENALLEYFEGEL